ncbi:MAG: KpsF/GutQ family sugar-phosphate isomerase [Rhodospirillales bacterium]
MTTSPAHKNSEQPDLESARRVLAAESGALNALAAGLGNDFIAALDVLEAAPGRVIVTGIGKSGHIARKIAATLASTGAPAFFVHPAEASHGDMGMLTEKDVLLALSNSGETPELANMVAYAARFEIPIVAVTAKAESALAKAARVALVYPNETEACPMGLAPTTSTTLQLGLGDALAVALLERRNFSADDFQVLHPGGQLGRRLLKVSDLMHAGAAVPLLAPETLMSEVLVEMTSKGFGCAGVVDGPGRLLGVITDGDLRRRMNPALLDATAAEIMTADPVVAGADMLASEAVRIMNANAVTNLFVVTDNRPVGVLHVHDCLRAGVA